MPPRKRKEVDKSSIRPPATSPEAREQQMISLADALAEEQLRDGTASSQVITHYLKLGTSREKLEQEKLKRENELKEAQIEQLASAKRIEELYAEALEAMRAYGGVRAHEHDGDEDYDED